MMPVFAQDVDEDIDEDLDEDIEDALGEARRKRARGRGYNKPRIEKSFATQAQLEAVSQRIGNDVRALDANVKTLEKSTRRARNDLNQNLMMMMMMPLLTKKTVSVTGLGSNGIPEGTQVSVDDGDMLTLMLPMMMLGGGMGSQGMLGNGSTNGNGAGGMDPMMMMLVVLAATGGLGRKST